jgi:hypothetical protein
VDRLLCQAWKKARDVDKMGAETFCQLHGKILELILPADALRQLLGCEGGWLKVESHLHSVVSSSDLGMMLFGFALGRILSKTMHGHIAVRLDAFSAQDIDEGSVALFKSQVVTIIEAIPNISMLPKLRTVEGYYRGVVLQRNVSSILEEVNFKRACRWRGLAVHQNVLEEFIYEDGKNIA